MLCHLPETAGFRVARPVAAADGSWCAGGWEAWRMVGGTADPRRPDEVIRAQLALDLSQDHPLGLRKSGSIHD
ncbi:MULTISPECIES: hypothetical protein [unclassified Streptomyces]|uniref:hypothetical protein n=1 Tax=unclassified Streptomyces TaxID=2593676 RepID=UPI003327C7A5